jgi:isopentenyl-diphosphate delta-isomerase
MAETVQRKAEHIRINLEEDVGFDRLTTGLERYRFVHQALPELDLDQVDVTTTMFGKSVRAPLLISSMTGGTEQARTINRHLAVAAQEAGIAMGLGSLRVALEDPTLIGSFRVRSVAPDILLFANLGAVQLNYGYTVDHCRRAVDLVEADSLILHFNPLKEALQAGGDTRFAGLGWGFSQDAARRLADAGVAAIDVAGAGGTSWSQVEMHRAGTEAARRVADTFRDWGISTADSIRMVRKGAPGLPIIASGGLGNGLDVAKTIALGARLAGMAAPFLNTAVVSSEAVLEAVQTTVTELRIAMFCIGATTLDQLRDTPLLVATVEGREH